MRNVGNDNPVRYFWKLRKSENPAHYTHMNAPASSVICGGPFSMYELILKDNTYNILFRQTLPPSAAYARLKARALMRDETLTKMWTRLTSTFSLGLTARCQMLTICSLCLYDMRGKFVLCKMRLCGAYVER